MSHCRAALLTGPAPGAIATIRLQGRQYQNIIRQLFQSTQQAQPDKECPTLHFGRIIDHEDLIDQVVIETDAANQAVEIHCHGGPRVVQRILLLLENQNVAIVPWEALHPPTSIAEEIQHVLPQAKTTLGVTALAAQHPGGLTAWVNKTVAPSNQAGLSLPEIQNQSQAILHSYRLAQILLSSVSIVLFGPANVGKSTLANALGGRPQSLVADLAGTTRDWTSQLIDIEGIPVDLIDTAGQRFSSDQLEQSAMTTSESMLQRADLALLVVQADGNEARQIESMLAENSLRTEPLIVVNKMDLLESNRQQASDLYISATTGENLSQLRRTIAQRLGFEYFDPHKPLIFTPRQQRHLEQVNQATRLEKAQCELKKLLDNRH